MPGEMKGKSVWDIELTRETIVFVMKGDTIQYIRPFHAQHGAS